MTYFEQLIKSLMVKHGLTRENAIKVLNELHNSHQTMTRLDQVRQQGFHSRLNMYNNYFK